MKKYILMLIVFSVLALAGCGNEKEDVKQTTEWFKATVIEVNDTGILVQPVETAAERLAGDRVDVPNKEGLALQISDIIAIEYDGSILETYPLQLGEVYSITLIERTTSVSAEDEITENPTTFSKNDLLIDGHELLEKDLYPAWNWENLKAELPEITDTYQDSFPGTPDEYFTYWECEGITYVTDDNYIIAIILTDDTYALRAGIKVGDELTQRWIEQYQLQYYGKDSSERIATIMTDAERKSTQKLDYDGVFTGTTFIPPKETSGWADDGKGMAVSFFVKEGIVTGICMEYIV